MKTWHQSTKSSNIGYTMPRWNNGTTNNFVDNFVSTVIRVHTSCLIDLFLKFNQQRAGRHFLGMVRLGPRNRFCSRTLFWKPGGAGWARDRDAENHLRGAHPWGKFVKRSIHCFFCELAIVLNFDQFHWPKCLVTCAASCSSFTTLWPLNKHPDVFSGMHRRHHLIHHK